MTTEDDFWHALEANPHDHSTRLVFADWLQDRDDPRAEGYRALGFLGKAPAHYSGLSEWSWWQRTDHDFWYFLDADWWLLLLSTKYTSGRDKSFRTRREAEDAAALAFAKLPPERRAELLAAPVREK